MPGGSGGQQTAGVPYGEHWGTFSSVQFSCLVMSDSLWPHGLQHARPACPSSTPGVYSNSCSFSQWCHPTISSSVIPFSSHLQSFPTSGYENTGLWPQIAEMSDFRKPRLLHLPIHRKALNSLTCGVWFSLIHKNTFDGQTTCLLLQTSIQPGSSPQLLRVFLSGMLEMLPSRLKS